jgi:hypothetical protein
VVPSDTPVVTPTFRRRHLVAAATTVTSLATVVGALSASADRNPNTTDCPAAESLVAGTTWHTHHLSKGVALSEGRHTDNHGYVDMHVLKADVTNKRVSFAPLVRRLAHRSPLSQLAANHPTLLAATNTGYFDFDAGAPLGPLVDRTHPWISSTTRATVVGFGTTGLVQAGDVSLSGTITTGRNIATRLAGLNVLKPGTGLTAYTSRWGSEHVSLPADAVTRYVSSGRVSSSLGRSDLAPTAAGGYLLVARGTTATAWLSALKTRAAATVSTKVTSTTSKPFSLAYGVGSQLVHQGVEGGGFTCRRRYPQPARTAIGYADGGKQLILALVADDPGAPMHGLDSAQMARLMKDLGASEAYLFDGSGSTELLARMPSTPSALSLRNYPADGAERPMPVGFGIFKR